MKHSVKNILSKEETEHQKRVALRMENLIGFSNFSMVILYCLSKNKKNCKRKCSFRSMSLFQAVQQTKVTNLCDCISLFFDRRHTAHKKAIARLH